MARTVILNRTMRVINRKNRIRFTDWNLVNTSMGGAWEPRNLSPLLFGSESKCESIDPDDMFQRIDSIEYDADGRDPFHRDPDSNMALIGGKLMLGVAETYSDDAV